MEEKRAIKLLTKRLRKQNRLRNCIITGAIALTGILLSVLFVVTCSAKSLLVRQSLKELGTEAEGCYRDITAGEYELLSSSNRFADISYDIYVGEVVDPQLFGNVAEVRYIEEKAALWSFCNIKEGKYPQNQNEILVDALFLRFMGKDIKVGDTLSLELKIGDTLQTDEFVICGIYAGNEVLGVAEVYVSLEYIEKVVYEIHSETEWKRLYGQEETDGVGLRSAFCRMKSGTDWETLMLQTWTECGLEGEPKISLNWVYMESGLNAGTVVLVVVLLLLIMFAGYLIIYNVFYISIVNEVQFYGRLKLIGMSNRQIHSVLSRQALRFYLIGMPIGVGGGYLAGKMLMPTVLSIMGTEMTQGYALSPVAAFLCAFFTGVTVFTSVRKPLRILTCIAPAHSANYMEELSRNVRIEKKKLSLRRMAIRNINRNKRRNRLVTVSVALVLVLFTVSMTLVKSIDFQDYMKMETASDIYVTSPNFVQDLELIDLGTGTLEAMQEKLSEKSVSPYYYTNSLHVLPKERQLLLNESSNTSGSLKPESSTEVITEHRYYYDWNTVQKFHVREGVIDYEKWSTGNYVIMVADMGKEYNQTLYHVGDVIELLDYTEDTKIQKNEDGKAEFVGLEKKTYTVMAVVDFYYALSVKFKGENEISTVLPVSVMKGHGQNGILFAIGIDTDTPERDVETLKEYMAENDQMLSYKTSTEVKAEFERFRFVMILLCGGLTCVIGMMAIINLINNMVTGIIERKRELRTMWAVGMTSKRCIRMLRYEGLYTVGIATAIGLVLGELLGYFGIQIASGSFAWLTYRSSVLPVLGLVTLFALLVWAVPYICQRKLIQY